MNTQSLITEINNLIEKNKLLEESLQTIVNLPYIKHYYQNKEKESFIKNDNQDRFNMMKILAIIDEKLNMSHMQIVNKLMNEISDLKNEIHMLKNNEKENIKLEIEEVFVPIKEEKHEIALNEVKTNDNEGPVDVVDEEVEEEEVEEIVEVEEQTELEEEIKSIETENKEEQKYSDEEDEEEELIEIEIDDITYCTNDENNGFIYEMDKEGNVGQKVGYLKDGDAYFDE